MCIIIIWLLCDGDGKGGEQGGGEWNEQIIEA